MRKALSQPGQLMAVVSTDLRVGAFRYPEHSQGPRSVCVRESRLMLVLQVRKEVATSVPSWHVMFFKQSNENEYVPIWEPYRRRMETN